VSKSVSLAALVSYQETVKLRSRRTFHHCPLDAITLKGLCVPLFPPERPQNDDATWSLSRSSIPCLLPTKLNIFSCSYILSEAMWQSEMQIATAFPTANGTIQAFIMHIHHDTIQQITVFLSWAIHQIFVFFRRTNINLSWEFHKKGSGGQVT